MAFVISYEYLGGSHSYLPDFLVRLGPSLTLVLEIKGHEDEQDRAKHQAAKRWVSAVNNWGQLGQWVFHVCKDPQMLGRELQGLKKQVPALLPSPRRRRDRVVVSSEYVWGDWARSSMFSPFLEDTAD